MKRGNETPQLLVDSFDFPGSKTVCNFQTSLDVASLDGKRQEENVTIPGRTPV